jgi:hypothetical protein
MVLVHRAIHHAVKLLNCNIMEREQITWRRFFKEGEQYLKAATPKKGKSKFNNEIRYNLLSMSLEGYIMAILDYHNALPDNHTYTDLINGLEKVMTIDSTLKERILKYENIQSICSIEKYHRTMPTDEELDDLDGAIREIQSLAHDVVMPHVES